MIMTSYDLLARNTDPSEEEIRRALGGNLCMCTGYVQIVRAVQAAATAMKTTPATPAGGGAEVPSSGSEQA
jgi:carbon-monoxide dehydrogenase small subunit